MSGWRRQAVINAPIEVVWELVGDPNRHPEWFPRIIQVSELAQVETDARFRQVTRSMGSDRETTLTIMELDQLRSIGLRCLDTGMYVRFRLTEAQDGTFADIEFGMEPTTVRTRVFDATMGKRYFRRWTDDAVDRLQAAASETAAR
jgi:carbon monoxide dehydrogenase subunit G